MPNSASRHASGLRPQSPAQGDYKPAAPAPGSPLKSEPASEGLSFRRWSLSFAFRILRTRTPFAAFLGSLLHLTQAGVPAPANALFPLPLPYFRVFRPLPSLGSRARLRIGFRRVTFVSVAALNYLHAGGFGVPRDALRRTPNTTQAKALGYIERLIRACGAEESIDVPSSSRRAKQLIARLSELSSDFALRRVSCDPYSRTFTCAAMSPEDRASALSPYRSLQADRLKLSGSANWDPTEYLENSLFMAFREPASLELPCVPEPGPQDVPLGHSESPSELHKLALLWDSQFLLRLSSKGPPAHKAVRLFNALKSPSTDRQIADRRGRNHVEGTIPGPSRFLPTGVSLTNLFLDPHRQRFSVNATDRKDFYHQLACPSRRSRCNLLTPPLPAAWLKETAAYRAFCAGEGLCESRGPPKDDDELFLGFGAILQGDALGVEFATSAHSSLLFEGGLLTEQTRILGSRLFPPGGREDLVEGLVIDDFYAISCPELSATGPPEATKALQTSQKIYDRAGLLGSREKDVIDSDRACCAGAEIDGSARTRGLGLALVGPPVAKRIGLAALSLEACRLEKTTDHLHLSLLGAWTSALMFRRPLMSVLQRAYGLIDASKVEPNSSTIVGLPRAVADEFVVLSALCHLVTSDVSAPWPGEVFASDSSEFAGAFVSASIDPELARLLWGAHHVPSEGARVLSRHGAALRRVDLLYEETAETKEPGPKRPPALRFHFLQIGARQSELYQLLRADGLRVGPWVDLSCSPEYDWARPRVVEWVFHLVENGLVDSILVGPPSGAFGFGGRSRRTLTTPWGATPRSPRTRLANRLAAHALALLQLCARCRLPCSVFHPASSALPFTPQWRSCAEGLGCQETRLLCPHRHAGWIFLSFGLNLGSLNACAGDCVLEGPNGWSFHPLLDASLASAFAKAVRCRLRLLESCDLRSEGLESVLVNELAHGLEWRPLRSWRWRRPIHINILESSTVYKLMCWLARHRPCASRFACLCDSNVARCCLHKGRSSSKALQRALRRLAVVQVSFGQYPHLPCCPTRLMPADGPSRLDQISAPGRTFLDSSWTLAELRRLAVLPRLRRWTAAWLRFTFLLSSLRPSAGGPHRGAGLAFRTYTPSPLDFDSTLGFPGEGPSCRSFGLLLLLWASSLFRVGSVKAGLSHGLPPRNSGDKLRSERRKSSELPPGRAVEPRTLQRREVLWTAFLDWLEKEGIQRDLFEDCVGFFDIDAINAVLSKYGRALYAGGRPYSHYSETINSFSARVPKARRLLQPAWDVAFVWRKSEPTEHHTAMPWQILVGLLTLSLTWGWVRVAGILALTFGGMLRIGEAISAKRLQLLLPEDVGGTHDFALFSIEEPKTRFRAARHQSVKIDQPDLLKVLSVCFGRLEQHRRLWPFSGQSLRTRFRQLCHAFDIQSAPGGGRPFLELASLRAGGATWFMLVTEDAEMLRRRGRWLSSRIMEIYVQEVTSLQFLPVQTARTRQIVYFALQSFTQVLEASAFFSKIQVPPEHWYILFATGTRA